MEMRTPQAREQYDAVVGSAAGLVVGVDFDGTLSAIVPDPAQAHVHPDGPAVLGELGRVVRAVAVITGRPAAQVVELGRLEEVADRVDGEGEILVLGQYGNQRWDSRSRTVQSPEPPEDIAAFGERLPGLLEEADAADAFVEDKGLALAVHTRRLADPRAAYERLRPVLERAASQLGLSVEPGRNVVEVRAPGMHKGLAVRAVAEEARASAFVFVGDDLGDLEAFAAVEQLRKEGMPGLLVCSGSEEETALAERADVVVDGPGGVMAFLRDLTASIRG